MADLPSSNSLLEALDEPALLVRSGRIVAANRAAERLMGDGLAGRDARVALRQPQAVSALAADGPSDTELVGVGGADRPWTMVVRPLGGGDILVRLVDRSEAIAAERMRVDFVANASHELRTPLATIGGYAETLGEDDLSPDLRRKFAGVIGTEAARMRRIIADLMSLSRIEADRFRRPRERIDLADLCREVLQQIGPLAERRDCAVEFVAPQAKIAIEGDRAQLLQALDNLLSNAVRYGGCERGPITLSLGVTDGRPFVKVRDQGRGIAADHLPRLTERFYRVDEARSRGTGGTGLGLSIVKHIAERHRALLDIRSSPGEGTEVTLSFPPESGSVS